MLHTQTFEALFLLGTAHCGSTLLGRMLGRHPSVLCVGEMMRTDRALELGFQCSCGESIRGCSFWGPRLEAIARCKNDYRKFDVELYAELARRSDASICFDLSKTLVWRSRRTWQKKRAKKRSGFVFLLRDSRGVLAATKRQGGDIAHATPKHGKWMRRLARFVESESERSHVMTYEGLCREPEAQLGELCDFLGIPWCEDVLRPADAEHHLLHSSASSYLKGSNNLRRDERWRSELTEAEIALIEREMDSVPILREHYLDQTSARYQFA